MERFADLTTPAGFVIPVTKMQRQRVRRARAAGLLRDVLPGIAVGADTEIDLAGRLAALARYDSDAVVLGAAAAASTWWPELTVGDVVATRRGRRAAVAGYHWSRERFPEELVREQEGVRLAGPGLSTLQLVDTVGTGAIDEALRRGACSLADLWLTHAALRGRRGTAA